MLAGSITIPSFAVESDTANATAIEFYKNKQYDQAAKAFYDAIAKKPRDAVAHYYLGNSLIGLGRLDDAEQAYEDCLANNPPNDIRDFAKKARKAIAARRQAMVVPAFDAAPAGTMRAGEQKKLEDSVEALKQRVRDRMESQTQGQIVTLQQQINGIKSRLAQDVADNTFFTRRGRARVSPFVAMMRSDANSRISQLQAQINMIRRQMRNSYERSTAEIDRVYSELSSQARATKGNIKPILTSRSLYVRDYVHFSGEDTIPEPTVVPLKATPGKYTPQPDPAAVNP